MADNTDISAGSCPHLLYVELHADILRYPRNLRIHYHLLHYNNLSQIPTPTKTGESSNLIYKASWTPRPDVNKSLDMKFFCELC